MDENKKLSKEKRDLLIFKNKNEWKYCIPVYEAQNIYGTEEQDFKIQGEIQYDEYEMLIVIKR